MKRKVWKYTKRIIGALIALMLMHVPFEKTSTASAPTLEPITITGTYKQTEARTVLQMVNEFRQSEDAWLWNSDNATKTYYTDLQPLTWDYNLEQIAIQRAIECAVRFENGHPRPDNSDCFTVTCNGTMSYGENIAGAFGVEYGFRSLREDNEPFWGQGHRAAMLSEGYTAFACAYFEPGDGYGYLVMEFGLSNSGASDPGVLNGRVTKDIPTRTDLMNAALCFQSGVLRSLRYGESVDLPEMCVRRFFGGLEDMGPSFIVDPSDYSPIEWSIEDASVCEIVNGRIVTRGVGTTKIIATTTYKGKQLQWTETEFVDVIRVERLDRWGIADQIYTGKPICPEVPVKYNGVELVKGVDYDILYEDNIEIGLATINVFLKGNYENWPDKTKPFQYQFTIVRNPDELIPISENCVRKVQNQIYTGKEIRPEIVVECNSHVLCEGVDYTIQYGNNTNPGWAFCDIYGIGDYKGYARIYFLIVKADETITPSLSGGVTITVTPSPIPNKPTSSPTPTPRVFLDLGKATLEKRDVLDENGNPIAKYYYLSYNGKELQKGIDYSSVSYKLNSETGEVREVFEGIGDYTGTKEVTYWYMDVMPGWRPDNSYIDLSGATVSKISDQVYTGKPITPKVVVTLNGKTLTEGKEYVIDYFANISPGRGNCEITGIGDYTGRVSVYFNIVEAGTPTKSPTVTPTVKVTNSPTPTLKPTPIGAQTPIPSPSPAITENVTVTPSEEASITPTEEPDISDMPTVSAEPTPTATPQLSPTPTLKPTEEMAFSATPSPEPTSSLNELQNAENNSEANGKKPSRLPWWTYLVILLALIVVIVILTMI